MAQDPSPGNSATNQSISCVTSLFHILFASGKEFTDQHRMRKCVQCLQAWLESYYRDPVTEYTLYHILGEVRAS